MRVFLDSVGCRLNQSEIEYLGNQLREAGCELVGSPEEGDVVVLNTCAVTTRAAADSRARARGAHRRNVQARVVVTGCWSTLEPQAAASLPGVTEVVSNASKDHLASLILGERPTSDRMPARLAPIPGVRRRTRAFIKVQDGCDHFCTYCATRIARGKARSTPIPEVANQVRAATQAGAKEVVLSGVSLGSFGADLPGNSSLAALVTTLLEETDVPRLRLSSIEPWTISAEFFELWSHPRLCRQLHLPLQAGSPSTLKRMGRKIGTRAYRRLIEQARTSIPGVAITTDLITGFPGEDEEEFERGARFVDELSFAGGHVFVYSPRPGTPATRLPGRVPARIAKRRSRRLREVLANGKLRFASRFIGLELDVLWESVRSAQDQHSSILHGLTDNYLRVEASGSEEMLNRITAVRITGAKGDRLMGEIDDKPKASTQLHSP